MLGDIYFDKINNKIDKININDINIINNARAIELNA